MLSCSTQPTAPLTPLRVVLNNPISDRDYESQLETLLKDHYAVVFVGHSGKGYIEPENLRADLHQRIEDIMQRTGMERSQLMVLAGATPQGIGLVYEVAHALEVPAMGIVADAGAQWTSAYCPTVMTVRNPEADDWSTRLPESGEEMAVTALRIAATAGRGCELIAVNGGPQAFEEALAAARAGFQVSVVSAHDPVPNGRPEPFKDPANIAQLLDAIHAQHH